MYNASLFGKLGIKPAATSGKCGLARMISIRNDMLITPISVIIKALHYPHTHALQEESKKVSRAVMRYPHIKGNPVSRYSPIAIPSTSARSVAAMAISARRYRIKLIDFG